MSAFKQVSNIFHTSVHTCHLKAIYSTMWISLRENIYFVSFYRKVNVVEGVCINDSLGFNPHQYSPSRRRILSIRQNHSWRLLGRFGDGIRNN